MVFDSSNDQRKCNLPTADEVAAVVPWSDTQVIRGCDITLHYMDGCLNKIPDSSPAYYPLYYVLLFPRGECGWSHDIPKQVEDNNLRQEYDSDDDEQERSAKTVTQQEYFAYQLYPRKPNEEILFMAGRLFQEYIVDAWASNDQSHLAWIRKNQKTLCAEFYQGLMDIVANDVHEAHFDVNNVGICIILPSSYLGSS